MTKFKTQLPLLTSKSPVKKQIFFTVYLSVVNGMAHNIADLYYSDLFCDCVTIIQYALCLKNRTLLQM